VGSLRITFLGTGTSMGVPVIGCECETCRSTDKRDKRLRTSILVQDEKSNIVIDSGPDFRCQMLRCGIKHLTALVFTHEHKDHTAGMDDVRAFNFIQSKPVEVYASERVEEALRREFHYAFAESKYPGVPEIRFHRIGTEPFAIEGMTFVPIEVMHHRMSVLGFRIGDFTYITDANHIPESQWKLLKGTKVLVLNALRKTTHISHFTLDEAIEIAQRLGAKSTYITHISHQMGRHADVSAELPAGVELAYDGLQITV